MKHILIVALLIGFGATTQSMLNTFQLKLSQEVEFDRSRSRSYDVDSPVDLHGGRLYCSLEDCVLITRS